MVAPGVTTADLDAAAERLVRDAGAEPAFKGYRGYPATLCASVNEQVVHGIPSKQPLASRRHHVARHGREAGRIFRRLGGDGAGRRGPDEAADAAAGDARSAREGHRRRCGSAARVSDIGHAIQTHVEAHGFSVVREFVGHGIGASLHEEPQIANYGEPGRGPRLAEGMTLAIEPMVNMGKPGVKVLSDGWTAVTQDGSLSAHFEHTVAVTQEWPAGADARLRAGTVPTSAKRGRAEVGGAAITR